ncbi:MAG: energy transducer TonB [Bacteroidota bacterium]|nr:energy transducer TonB [Bacteroidota bacterium]
MKKQKILFFNILYNILAVLSKHIRNRSLIKWKLALGLFIITNKSIKGQEVNFPNKEKQADTLTLNIEMKEEPVTLCYEVVVVNYKHTKKGPEFVGGQRKLNRFVQKNVIYPKLAREKRISGDVAVNVYIQEDGQVFNAEIVKGLGSGLDEEALRLAKLLPKFKPGKINNKASESEKIVIIHFELPQNAK